MSLVIRNGIYESHITSDGVRYRRSTSTSNRRLADQIDRKFKDELTAQRNQLVQFNPYLTFGELAIKFIAEGLSKPWHLDRLKILLPYFSDTRLSQINKGTARQFRVARHKEKQLTDTTINRDLECLRHLLFWAMDEGLISSNPLSRMRLEQERKKKRPVLSLEEEMLLLPACAPHLAPIVTAALESGMRRSEILQQDWRDIDFGRRLLFVTKSKTAGGESREIPLTSILFNLLWERRQNEGPIFTYEGKPIKRIKTAWKAAIRRAGIRYLPFHYLRHTHNSRMLEAGVLREVRMAIMGHSTGNDPQSTYEHVELPLKREAMQKLEDWREKQTQKLLTAEPR